MNRRWRPWLWAGFALAAFAVATALATPGVTRSPYDPQSASPEGTRALAQLLGDAGVEVERTTDAARAMRADAGETLVVAYPELLPPDAVRGLEQSGADVVLLGPTSSPKGYLGIVADEPARYEDREPACELPAATTSGTARTGGPTLVPGQYGGPTIDCYPSSGLSGPTLVQRMVGPGSSHTVLASAEFMTNEWLGQSGNAALAMNLLGSNPQVVWWLPSPVYTGTQTLTSVLPDGVWPVLGALVVLVLVLAAWKGRRLGPVVTEQLPVAVRASETTEGRARIYQRHHTRARAAQHLRDLTATQLSRRLGLPANSDQSATVSAVAAATGRPSESVNAVLYGPPPERDDDLVALGQHLADLDREVRRS
ncbi:MAG TPA: DUF4350 domain-containing protein [Actinomycetes bacterium]|nr:DUF4350 domain-containing protein [Actinomycetes bacterium]